MSKLLLLLLIALATTVYCQQDINFICNAQASCNDCIQASPFCSWCTDPVFIGSRCYATLSNATCNETNSQDPHGNIEGTSNDAFTDSNQISPLNVNLTLRRGEPVTFQVRVRPARNYPLDLYLLMDLSYSMRDDLANLKTLGGQIATAIQSITTNYNLGFGAFVDKPIAPYVSIVPDRLRDPCNDGCEGPYSYRHVSSLGNNTEAFNDGIQARSISGNLDSPEGGFDGFLQSIVCQNLIGWRQNARHLLLYITDAGFHYAGDGKLGGAIIPHNGECLMGEQGTAPFVDYRDYATLDYPSVGQIREMLRRFDIIPLFAATSGSRRFYDALADELASQGAEVGTLAGDSSNVVTLIEESYRRISQRVLITPDNTPGITFNITAIECPMGEITNQQCNGLNINETAVINITATLLQCSSDNSPKTVTFRVLGFGTFTVQVQQLCQCQCENDAEMNSPSCNNNGTLTCGACNCNPGRFGETCQCDITGVSGDGNNTMCSTINGQICSGRGSCICGRCECETPSEAGRMYFGANCECDNFDCDRNVVTNEICSGSERGICSCSGMCECLNSPLGVPYEGTACECDADRCVNPDTREICSGNGQCDCDRCVNCTGGYDGTFCHICTNASCAPVSCDESRLCAQCALNITTIGCENCTLNITMMNNIGPDLMIDGVQPATCDFQDDDECEYRYFVGTNGDVAIDTGSGPTCPVRTPAWVVAVAVIAALLVLGLIALALIKLLLMLLDYIEVKKFMSEVQDPKFRKNENPLFQSPNKEYKNPVYGQ